jgi:hypothetical protein
MSDKFLYYFGAGASCNVLPLARTVKVNSRDIPGLPDALQSFDLNELSKLGMDSNVAEKFKLRFEDLANKARPYDDVDTYAKFLYIKGKTEEFDELKQTLALFFVIRQRLLPSCDKRYLPWLIALLESKRFPDNVKVVSWNYDFQIETAFTSIDADKESVTHSPGSFIHTPGSLSYFPNIDPTFSDYERLSVIHLNGIAGIVNESLSNTSSAFQPKYENNNEEFVNYLQTAKFHTRFHFAWEHGDYHANLTKHLSTLLDKVKYLVVVGYSFPFYNRKVDKEIFDILKRNKGLKKIYFQDPVLSGEDLRSKFDLWEELPIVPIKQTDSFHIPFEL